MHPSVPCDILVDRTRKEIYGGILVSYTARCHAVLACFFASYGLRPRGEAVFAASIVTWSITTTRNRAEATMATNVTDALVAAWCAALPYPAEDLVGTANDAWAVPQTSQTALGASVAASLSTLSADAAEAALPRWHDASLAAAATTFCVDAAAALDGVYRAREAALHARRALEAAATEAAAARTNGEPETGRGLAAGRWRGRTPRGPRPGPWS